MLIGQAEDVLTVRLPERIHDVRGDLVVVHHVAHHLFQAC